MMTSEPKTPESYDFEVISVLQLIDNVVNEQPNPDESAALFSLISKSVMGSTYAALIKGGIPSAKARVVMHQMLDLVIESYHDGSAKHIKAGDRGRKMQ
jgi:hypothetical protein